MEIENIISYEELQEAEKFIKEGLVEDFQLKELMRYLYAAENFKVNHPIDCYVPIPKTRDGGPYQLAFHQTGHIGRGLFGGNQVGKTKAGSFEVAFHFTNHYPDWYPKEKRLPRINNGRIIVKDFPKSVGEVIEPALLLAIPKHYIADTKRNSKGYLIKMKSTTGAWFDIVTHDMDDESLEGWQGDWAWFDEPPPRKKFTATLRGLIRRSGRWWITCTPLTEPWMYDEIYTNLKYLIITVDMRDNPYLSERDIAEFESHLTEEEKEARMHGRFMHLSGLTYKEFRPDVHIKPRTTVIPEDWPRYHLVDPHDRKPFAMAWWAVDPMGRIWIYDEWPNGWFHEMRSSNRGLKDYLHIIREKELGQRIFRRVIDGRAGKAPKMGEESADSLIDLFDGLGLYPVFEPSYICLSTGVTDPGHQKVKEFLRLSPVTGEPSLFVLENCKNMIYSFQHNTWDEKRDPMMASERQGQFAKDFLDLIKYGLMDNPVWVEKEDWQPMHDNQTQPKWVEDRQAQVSGINQFFGAQIDF